MANIIIIAGQSGTGKTLSLRNMPRTRGGMTDKIGKTVILQSIPKELFEYDKTGHLGEFVTIPIAHDGVGLNHYVTLRKTLTNLAKNANYIVIDDIKWLMGDHYRKVAHQTGFNKFNEIGFAFVDLLDFISKSLPRELIVVLMFHTENVISDGVVVGSQIQLFGKLVQNDYNPLELVNIYLQTIFSPSAEIGDRFQFVTNTCQVDGHGLIYAKTPINGDTVTPMFPNLMTNDLALVLEKLGYYKPPTVEEIAEFNKSKN